VFVSLNNQVESVMPQKFHVAMYCSPEAFKATRDFYTGIFGDAPEGPINEGSTGHSYHGVVWDNGKNFVFALLVNREISGPHEYLAHVGFIFDDSTEYNSEINRRAIDVARVQTLSGGQRQVFISRSLTSQVEWEFSCSDTRDE
jgi:hypothetical protein